jgi:DNA-binding NtrC family response regulator
MPDTNHSKIRALLAEHESGYRKDLTEVLTRLGLAVDSTHSLDSLREQLEVNNYRLLVTSAEVVGGPGSAFLKRLPDDYPGLATIVITSEPSIESVLRSLRAGACDYLVRPFSYSDLVDALARAGIPVEKPQAIDAGTAT